MSRLLCAFLTLCLSLAAAQQGATTLQPARTPVVLRAPVQDKNFYVLSLLEETTSVAEPLRSDATLGRLLNAKREKLAEAVESCAQEIQCYTSALLWSAIEMEEAEHTLRRLYRQNSAIRELTDRTLRRSGMYVRYHDRTGENLLAQAWRDAAHGVNNVIEVYGIGKAPRYPQIDSVSYDTRADSYRRLVHVILSVLNEQSGEFKLFFQPPLRFAVALMDANRRDEAGRFEPLDAGENRPSLQRIPSIRWTEYPYSVIVIPGAGADTDRVNLSAWAKMRLVLAARRFQQRKAPLILVTGGFVHPAQTPFCEALEMKKSLVADFGIPGDAILIEPHARHTTTNLRNAARLIYRYRIPFDKPSLITTDPYQSRYIESERFNERCARELGYWPHRVIARTSAFDLEWLPRIESLHADATDPLDP